MATLTSNFIDTSSLLAAASAAQTALSAETALSLATAAWDRAEGLPFAGFTTRTSTVVSGLYANGDSATLVGGSLTGPLPYATNAGVAASIQRLDYRFAGGESAVLTGAWARHYSDWPFIGPVDRALVTSAGESVTLVGVRPVVPPNVVHYVGTWGFDHQPAVGADGLAAIRFDKGGASVTYRGALTADTVSVNGALVSTIAGTVHEITFAVGTGSMTVAGLSIGYEVLENAGAQEIVSLAMAGNDTVTGSAAGQQLQGGGGHDTVFGLGGDDRLEGGAGNDRLEGGLGNDTLEGGAGIDMLVGGAGDDLYLVESALDQVVESAGGGNDTVLTALASFGLEGLEEVEALVFGGTGGFAGVGNGASNRLTGGAGADMLAGGAGHDTLVGLGGQDALSGDAGSDLLRGGDDGVGLSGGEGNDVLVCGAGDDLLLGDAGADVMLAGQGNDTLRGGSGRDTLVGGAGDDTLTGGGDADRFVLNSTAGVDEITDFVSGLDHVAINRSVFTVAAPAGPARVGLAALGTAFSYDAGTGELTYEAVTIARFTPGLALADDFLVIG